MRTQTKRDVVAPTFDSRIQEAEASLVYIYTNTSWKNKWRKEEWVEWRRVA